MAKSETSKSPNFLVFMTDQHNPSVMGCSGDAVVRTPTLDRLAARGTRFADCYCPSPLCVPSRMSFMTARYPHRNRVWCNRHILSSAIPTFAHALGIAGYSTALIGRMHFEGPDQLHGFEARPFGEYCANHPGVPRPGGPAFTVVPRKTTGQTREAVEIAGRGRGSYQWYDERVTEAASSFIENHAGSADDRPFAAVVGYVLPHCPFIGDRELFDYYYERVTIPSVEERQPSTITRFRRDRDILRPLPDERIRVARAAYYAMVEESDRLIGKVIESVERAGLTDHTVIVYCSDHGEMAGAHGCWWKSNYYENSAGVPLIVSGPGCAAAGRTSDTICNLTDIGPTLVEAAGGTPMPRVNGRSLWSEIVTGARPELWAQETFSELVDARSGESLSRMVRRENHKLWRAFDDEELPPALFDLSQDPVELDDLGGSKEAAGIISSLEDRLTDGWDPTLHRAAAREATADYKLLAEWGGVIRPSSPYQVPQPPPWVDTDVDLL